MASRVGGAPSLKKDKWNVCEKKKIVKKTIYGTCSGVVVFNLYSSILGFLTAYRSGTIQELKNSFNQIQYCEKFENEMYSSTQNLNISTNFYKIIIFINLWKAINNYVNMPRLICYKQRKTLKRWSALYEVAALQSKH